MARGTTLANIAAMVKAELLLQSSDTVAPGGDATLYLQIAMQQQWLALRYEWPFLQKESDVAMVPGTQYYAWPQVTSVDVFDLGRPVQAWCYQNGIWNACRYGITPSNYNSLDPDLDQRSDPVLAWQLYRTSTLQFEVWPLPSTATVLRLMGQMVLPALAASSDTAVLDDILIAQFTAAKLAARLKSADAPALLAQAQATLQALRAGYPQEVATFNTSGSSEPPRGWEKPTVVSG